MLCICSTTQTMVWLQCLIQLNVFLILKHE
jgi:hypothetical protein